MVEWSSHVRQPLKRSADFAGSIYHVRYIRKSLDDHMTLFYESEAINHIFFQSGSHRAICPYT